LFLHGGLLVGLLLLLDNLLLFLTEGLLLLLAHHLLALLHDRRGKGW